MDPLGLVFALLFLAFLGAGLIVFATGRRRAFYSARLGIQGDVVVDESKPEDFLRARQGLLHLGTYEVAPSGPLAFLQREIRRAALRISAPDIVMGCLVAFFAAGFTVAALGGGIFWACVAGIWAFVLPVFFLRLRAARRIQKVEDQLADALDMVVAALHAGVAIRAALELVRTDMKDPVKAEFNDLLTRIDFGVPAPQAFREWAMPLGSRILTLLSVAMAAKWDVGGNFSDMLINLGRRVRESIRLRRRVEALTAEARFSMIIAYVAPYAVGMILWLQNPGYMERLFSDPVGVGFIQFALLLQLISIPWAWWILKIDY